MIKAITTLQFNSTLEMHGFHPGISTFTSNNDFHSQLDTCLERPRINFLSIERAATPLLIFPKALLVLPNISTPESNWKGWLSKSFRKLVKAAAHKALLLIDTSSWTRGVMRICNKAHNFVKSFQ